MKLLIVSGLLCLVALWTSGQTRSTPMTHKAKLTEKIALACKLTEPDQIKRMNELHQTLFKRADKLIEHKRSYEVVFQQPDDSLSTQLIEFIRFERLCCPWLKFQLSFQPGEGPVSLKLGDSVETKAMVGLVMGLTQLPKTGW